jgi:multidrug efflux pump subunit AcrA (membrane-fusion protein)
LEIDFFKINFKAMPENQYLDVHSQEVQEILGRIPGWIVRWGLSLVFVIFAGIILGSYLVSYPEVVSAPLVITTHNTPAALQARATGKLSHIMVSNQELVSPGQVVAVIENPAQYHGVIALQGYLDRMIAAGCMQLAVTGVENPGDLSLGELQGPYSTLRRSRRQFEHYLQSNQLPLKIRLLENQILLQDEIFTRQQRQLEFQREDLALSRAGFERDSMLSLMGSYAISQAEYERSRQGYIQRQAAFAGHESSLKNTEAGIIRFRETLVDLEINHDREMSQHILAVEEGLQQLRAAIDSWREQYVILTPIEGRITNTIFWSENQVIKAGDRFATVVPVDESRIIAKAKVPPGGFGKVETGQKVNIKLSGFPFMEFGTLRGKITAISLVPEEQGYVADIELTGGMTTTYREQLRFIQEMDGVADIITKDTRAIYRVIQPLRYFVESNRDNPD